MSIFRIGQKVVCIEGGGDEDDDSPPPYAVTGAVYTIAEIYDHGKDTVALNFDELWSYEDDENFAGYESDYFRPVKTTSIEVFKAMLAPKKQKEPA